jgi:hypothetical protein
MPRKAKTKAQTAVITKISINFPKELWKDLKRRALEDEETVTDILVRLATGYVAKQKRAAK